MLIAFAQRRAVLGSAIFVISLIVYVWCFHLLNNLGGGIPSLNHHIDNLLNKNKNNNSNSNSHSNNQDHDQHHNQHHEHECPVGTHRHVTNETLCVPNEKGRQPWKRPSEVKKIMGLVFFGRRATVSILDCYLKRNLVKHGGVLDGVIFLQRTRDETDLKFLDKLIESEPDYERWEIDLSRGGYASSYDKIEDDVLYIKMDDDIVYIEDTVLPSLVTTKATHPEFYVVSANVVNQPLLSWVHWSLGAVRPYLPELNTPYPAPKPGTKLDWRTSLLPAWDGSSNFEVKDWSPPDHQKHRWLPLRGKVDHVLDRTPILETDYDPFGAGWSKWQVAAQEHYSLFENIENGELDRYRFGTWDFQYRRMGIQFIAISGKDINQAKPIAGDDEHHFAVTMPQKLGRHAVADGGGVVSHYSFSPQSGKEKIGQTDILERYRSYAEEFICEGPMLWDSVLDKHS